MKRLISILAIAAAFMFSLWVSALMAQPIDYCEGNFDNDLDQDGTDAFVFKSDFGRSSLLNPCPVIECQTAEELEVRIVQLETQLAQVTTLLANVTRGTVQGQDTIRFSGMNVQIVDGSGTTDGTTNGRGNLIVGYNELRNAGDDRNGSHNIVTGLYNNYSSYGGLVAGYYNASSGSHAIVTGGVFNTASGSFASVSGGEANTAVGYASSVSGGYDNTASGSRASVTGGGSNTASGSRASVSGGRYNEASGDYSFVGGGGDYTSIDGNTAFANYSAVLGGKNNCAGDIFLTDHTIGDASSVTGGRGNTAAGYASSVSGGRENTANGWVASVTGGWDNTASGVCASVSGGASREATGETDWVGGSLWENN